MSRRRSPAVFLLGVFWKRASGKSAFITLISGMALGFVAFYLDWNNIYRGDFMLIAFLLLVACLLIYVCDDVHVPGRPQTRAKPLIWEDWREPCAAGRRARSRQLPSGNRPRLLVFAVLYLVFH
jgi:SSS family solute:Na+ symporter